MYPSHLLFYRIALLARVLFGVMLSIGPSFGQARLIIHDDAYVRIDNAAWMVVVDPTVNGITTSGTGGNIRSEGEFNRVRWQIRDNMGTYTMPFASINGEKIPFSYTVLTPGSNEAGASIVFATYNHASSVAPALAFNNDLYRPSDVTHMNNYFNGALANSENAVDRFWIVDASAGPYAYGAKPSVELGFTYENNATSGEVMPGNAIGPADPVGAQRFNSGTGQWGDMLPMGTWSGGALGSVVGATIPAADLYRSWTLANLMQPLPVTLLTFTATCELDQVALDWTTASELNSDHFRVERSLDGDKYAPIGRVEAAGISTRTIDYRLYDPEPSLLAYYRLVQVDRDGTESVLGVRVAGCDGGGGTEIVSAWDDGTAMNVVVRSHMDQEYYLRLLDAAAKEMYGAPVELFRGLNTIRIPRNGMAQGVYIVRMDGNQNTLSRRVPMVF